MEKPLSNFKYEKTFVSLLRVDKFHKIHNRIPTYSHLSSCVNDLFCYWRKPSLRTSNPITKEVTFLPNTYKHIPWCNYSLDFEPKERKYKVISAKHHAQEGYIKYWIFTLVVPMFALVELSISSFMSLL